MVMQILSAEEWGLKMSIAANFAEILELGR
jgi:hypothetical protein